MRCVFVEARDSSIVGKACSAAEYGRPCNLPRSECFERGGPSDVRPLVVVGLVCLVSIGGCRSLDFWPETSLVLRKACNPTGDGPARELVDHFSSAEKLEVKPRASFPKHGLCRDCSLQSFLFVFAESHFAWQISFLNRPTSPAQRCKVSDAQITEAGVPTVELFFVGKASRPNVPSMDLYSAVRHHTVRVAVEVEVSHLLLSLTIAIPC